MKTKLLLGLIILLLLPVATAQAEKTGSINLLAMSELDKGIYRGSIADLTLEIQEGKGRVFVNTFPISKIDTQISMRFAQQIACKHAEIDCSKYDFIYTIKAQSSIIGGPSAGAATSILTISLLTDLKLDENTAITGTINSGDLIGPVGGIKAKIDAAAKSNIKKVLVPKGSVEKDNETNIIEHGKELGIEIVEVSTLNDALYHFTGKTFEKPKKDLVVDKEYTNIMKTLAVALCNRTNYLQEQYLKTKPENVINETILEHDVSALEEKEKSKLFFDVKDYYTAASYCFRANIEYKYLSYYFQNLTEDEKENKTHQLGNAIEVFEDYIDSKQISTITDMQAYMITKERIDEAEERKNLAIENLNNTKEAVYWLAFATERLNSAESWSSFFGAKGQEFIIDNETLKQSCQVKISEAEERYQYVNFYFPDILSQTRKEIDKAKSDMKAENYIMCLYKASRAKAQADTVMSMIGVGNSMINETIMQKISAAEQAIIEQQDAGIFPIMGYSYFEYANSLKEEDSPSSTIYAEYALELSNFDFYFEKKKAMGFSGINKKLAFILVLGICIGYLISVFLSEKKPNKKQKTRHDIRIRSAKRRKSSH